MGVNSIYQPGMSALELGRRMFDSAWMVLSMNDPPRLAWYAAPLIAAPAVAIAALARVPRLGDVPLSMVLFFLASISGALVARGVAYSGRFSTIVIGSAAALTVAAIATVFNTKNPNTVCPYAHVSSSFFRANVRGCVCSSPRLRSPGSRLEHRRSRPARSSSVTSRCSSIPPAPSR
jgi:hypothetical protein